MPITGVIVARPQMVCRPVTASNPQYVLARVETHPNPVAILNPNAGPQANHNPAIHKLPSPMSAGPKPIASTSSSSPRKMLTPNLAATASAASTFPRACGLQPIRPPPPPPPPRTTPVAPNAAGPVRPSNPVLHRPSLQQRGNFHESPDEGYHEDEGGSEAL